MLNYLNWSIFTVFVKNRNFISKIRRSKVTDYAALKSLHGGKCHKLFSFQNQIFQKFFQEITIRVSKNLNPDQDRAPDKSV